MIIVRVSTGGRPSDSSVDNIINTGTSHRLQQTVYEPRHQYHDQETRETETWCLLVHGPSALQ